MLRKFIFFAAVSHSAFLGITSQHISLNQFSQLVKKNEYVDNLPIVGLYTGRHSYREYSGWVASYTDGLWYQVDLYILHELHGIITQGSGTHNYQVESFSLGLSNDTFNWTMITDATGQEKVSFFTLFK